MTASTAARTRALAVVAAATLLAGCGAGGAANDSGQAAGSSGVDGTTSPGDSGTGSPGEPSETFGSPTVESTEVETTIPSASSEDVAIALPRLPIGGNATTDEEDPARQCVGIDWIVTTDAAPEVRHGYAVAVTGAVFDGPGFEVDPAGCRPDTGSGRPNCVGHVMRIDSDACDLGVRALPDADPNTVVTVALSGALSCAPGVGSTACRRFSAEVAAEPGVTIELNSAPATTSPPLEPTTEESGSESSLPSAEPNSQSSEEESGSTDTPSGTDTGTTP